MCVLEREREKEREQLSNEIESLVFLSYNPSYITKSKL